MLYEPLRRGGHQTRAKLQKMEKAFENEKMGKVLGIFIDSTIMGWSLPADKKRKAINSITECIESSLFNLLKMQKVSIL